MDRAGHAFLEKQKDQLGIGEGHCLAERVKTLCAFEEWHKNIMGIPESYIKDSVDLAVAVGLPEDEASFCVQFLLDRRSRLPTIFASHRKEAFPNLDEGLLDPFSSITAKD